MRQKRLRGNSLCYNSLLWLEEKLKVTHSWLKYVCWQSSGNAAKMTLLLRETGWTFFRIFMTRFDSHRFWWFKMWNLQRGGINRPPTRPLKETSQRITGRVALSKFNVTKLMLLDINKHLLNGNIMCVSGLVCGTKLFSSISTYFGSFLMFLMHALHNFNILFLLLPARLLMNFKSGKVAF